MSDIALTNLIAEKIESPEYIMWQWFHLTREERQGATQYLLTKGFLVLDDDMKLVPGTNEK
jgi:hypothetical protein